jgi:hypothetical protein
MRREREGKVEAQHQHCGAARTVEMCSSVYQRTADRISNIELFSRTKFGVLNRDNGLVSHSSQRARKETEVKTSSEPKRPAPALRPPTLNLKIAPEDHANYTAPPQRSGNHERLFCHTWLCLGNAWSDFIISHRAPRDALVLETLGPILRDLYLTFELKIAPMWKVLRRLHVCFNIE